MLSEQKGPFTPVTCFTTQALGLRSNADSEVCVVHSLFYRSMPQRPDTASGGESTFRSVFPQMPTAFLVVRHVLRLLVLL